MAKLSNMADRQKYRSISETNSDERKSLFDASIQSSSTKGNKLELDGKTYRWTGNLEELKNFIQNDMKLSGTWSSPGGESKLFKAGDEFSIKWYGRKSKKIVIVKDNEAELLLEMFKEHASMLKTVDAQVNNTSKNQTYNILTSENADDYSGIHNCACNSAMEVIEDMKLNMEILRSRVDALQSLANANEVCPPIHLYLNKIDRLEQEILHERKKTNQLQVELASLKKRFPEQGHKQDNVGGVIIEGSFMAEEISKEPEDGESHLLDDSCTMVRNDRNNNANYFALQLQEYKEKQSGNFTRFHKQTRTNNRGRDSLILLDDSCVVVQTKDANQINNRDNNEKFAVQLQEYKEKQSGNFARSLKKIRINKKYKARKRNAHHSARKLNSAPCNTYNENFARGLDWVSSGQRMQTLNLNKNKSRVCTHSNSHPYQPANFRGQRAHIPKFLQRSAWDQLDWRKYLEFVRRVTTRKETNLVHQVTTLREHQITLV